MMRTKRLSAGVAAGFLIAGLGLAGALGASAAPGDPVFPISDALLDNLPTATDTFTLEIHKTAGQGTTPGSGVEVAISNDPIAGVVYLVKQVTDCPGSPKVEFDLTTTAGWTNLLKLGTTPAAAVTYADQNCTTDVVDVFTTDSDGIATAAGLPAGLYLVVEMSAPTGVIVDSAPFLVTLPLPNSDGSNWITKVVVQPKNLLETPRTPATKTVIDWDAILVGDPVVWVMTFPVPDEAIESYDIVDFLDPRIDCLGTGASLEASLTEAGSSTATPLVKNTNPAIGDYSGVLAPWPAGTPTQTLLALSFSDPTGIAKLNASPDGTITVTLTCRMAAGTVGEVPNLASYWVNSDDPLTDRATGETNLAWHKTGTLSVTTLEGDQTTLLPGVKFSIRYGEELVVINGESVWTTDAVGEAVVAGLRYTDFVNNAVAQSTDLGYQEYAIVWIDIPEGYTARTPNPIVTINDTGTFIPTGAWGGGLFYFDKVPPPTPNLPLQLPLIGSIGTEWLGLIAIVVLATGYTVVVRKTRSQTAG